MIRTEENRVYDAKTIMELCNINSLQALLQWLKNNLDKINTDDEVHAQKVGKSWMFDDVALQRIQELRKVGSTVSVLAVDNERIRELEEEKAQLKDNLMMAQTVLNEKQEQMLRLQSEALASMKLLSDSHEKEYKAQADADVLKAKNEMLQSKIEELTAERDALKVKIESIEKENQELKNHTIQLQMKLQQEQNKGFLAKLFG